jgi:hypothetical protein
MSARFANAVSELMRRLEDEPSVAGVTFASSYPGNEAFVDRVEIEGAGERSWVWINQVDRDLFGVFGIPVLAGRDFTASDAGPGSNAVIVDRVFAEHIIGGGNVLGRRVRRWRRTQEGANVREEPGPWLEIVGVVPAYTPPPTFERVAPKLYEPLALAAASAHVELAIRLKSGSPPALFTGRLRELAESVEPALGFDQVQTASEEERQRRQGLLSLALAIVAVTGSVLLLSAAGIYAMMSFTVASRRREIGIRAALGAAPGRVLRAILARAGKQVGAGALAGLLLAEAIPRLSGGSFFAGEGIVMLPVVLGVVITIGLLAALGPARRGLAIQPTEALREE